MVRISPWALLAFSSIARAQLVALQDSENLLEGRGHVEQCCPCPGPGSSEGPKTITVIQPAGPTHTVTITQPAAPTQTVTVTEHGSTVTVTQGGDNVITKVITVQPVETVNPAKGPEVVTITVGGGGKKTVTLQESGNQIITKTVQNGNGQDHTVIVRPEPTTKTITLTNGVVTTTVFDVDHTITVTAPAQVETITRQGSNVQTVTRTVTADGKTEVEIVVIDETGVVSCKKKDSGQPCHHNPGGTQTEQAIPTECGSVPVSTSIKTVYNTVVVTLGPALSHNATMLMTPTTIVRTEEASSTLSQRPGRMARAPVFKFWW